MTENKRFRMTENKRFRMTETELIFMVLDNEKALSRKEIVDKLNNLTDENEDLKKSVNNLKETLVKITMAYQKKYGETIIDLIDEKIED